MIGAVKYKMKLFFRLGINPNLSLAEIQSYLESAGYDFTIEAASREAVIFQVDKIEKPEQAAQLIKELGGTIKVGEVFGEVSKSNLKMEIRALVIEELRKFESKKFFGFSVVGQQKDFKNVSDLNKFALDIKGELGGSIRVVSTREIELSSVIVQKEKLLRRGGDFNIIYIKDKAYLGKTLAVQEFEEYGFRDYSRPGIDAKSGMLPPKLAKMMIGLSRANKAGAVLDPFCGSGTVIFELLLKGYSKVIGSDNSPKAISDSQKNLQWFAEKFHFDVDQVRLFEADARKLDEKIESGSVAAIVTEPYLGPALRGSETKEKIFMIKRELEELYREAIGAFAKLVEKGGKIVMVVPVFVYKDEVIYLDIMDDFQKNGFAVNTGFENIEGHSFRYPLVYRRPGQKLYREIVVANKTS